MRDALVRSKNIPTVRLASAVGLAEVAQGGARGGDPLRHRRDTRHAAGDGGREPARADDGLRGLRRPGRGGRPAHGPAHRRRRRHGDLVHGRRARARAGDGRGHRLPGHERPAGGASSAGRVRPCARAGSKAPAAGKTGTTNDATDTWFVGYTPRLVAAVWMGFDEPRPIMGLATGGRLAAPVWGRMMVRAPGGAHHERDLARALDRRAGLDRPRIRDCLSPKAVVPTTATSYASCSCARPCPRPSVPTRARSRWRTPTPRPSDEDEVRDLDPWPEDMRSRLASRAAARVRGGGDLAPRPRAGARGRGAGLARGAPGIRAAAQGVAEGGEAAPARPRGVATARSRAHAGARALRR